MDGTKQDVLPCTINVINKQIVLVFNVILTPTITRNRNKLWYYLLLFIIIHSLEKCSIPAHKNTTWHCLPGLFSPEGDWPCYEIN